MQRGVVLPLQGYTDAVKWLLQQGADATCHNEGGSTPLHSAVSHGQSMAAELLVYMGWADPLAQDAYGDTPQSLAGSLGHASIAQLFAAAHDVRSLCCKLDAFIVTLHSWVCAWSHLDLCACLWLGLCMLVFAACCT